MEYGRVFVGSIHEIIGEKVMELVCNITNVNGNSFPNLEFRKLRQVIFFGENRKTINIYSTIIVAGNGDVSDAPQSIISQLNQDFKMKIEFCIVDDNIKIKNQESREFINSFYAEIDKIKPIWGKDCKIIDKQTEIARHLENRLDSREINNTLTAIGEKKYFSIDSELLACPGDIEKDENKNCVIKVQSPLHEGVDCIACFKTTIFLSQKMPPKTKVSMRLNLPAQDNVQLSYISIYICPPEGYHLNNDSRVKAYVKGKQDSENADEFNNLSEVAPKESIYYKEWIKKEHIMSRAVYRLNREKLFKNQDGRIKNCRNISIEFHMSPVTEKGSPQFVLGALFSAAVTYGIDSGRLLLATKGFISYIPNDFQWLLFCFITFWTFIRWCSRKYNISNENNKCAKIIQLICLLVGTVSGGVWTIVTFVISRIKCSFIIRLMKDYWKIAPLLLGCSAVTLSVYIVISYTYMRKYYGRKPISRELFY